MMSEPPRAVLDSSVLVPAWSRLLLSTLAAAQPALYGPVWCEWIIAETWRVLTVQRLRRLSVVTPADERQLSASANATDALDQLLPLRVDLVAADDPHLYEAARLLNLAIEDYRGRLIVPA